MRHVVLLNRANGFKQCRNAGLIVCTKNRCSITANPAVFTQFRLNALPRCDSIHMASEKHRGYPFSAFCFPCNNEITGTMPRFLHCIVLIYAETKSRELFF
ncbi:hypothetical protein D3C75_1182320 [compost metagenome]